MGGIIGAMVVGLALVIWLLMQSNSNNNNAGPVAAVTPGVNTGATIMSEQTAPRMPIDQFKALYDNPATRPVIIDVRAKQSYDEGHIAGAISFPEAEADARIAELPKDRLIIAYCQ
jgi:3-mercaptopyruvate sulfurtransferase SseA